MPDPTDFIARRHATIQAEYEQLAERDAEEEFQDELLHLEFELEKRMECDRAQRRKYWEAMVQKRGATTAR
jgi:hypothetical protein